MSGGQHTPGPWVQGFVTDGDGRPWPGEAYVSSEDSETLNIEIRGPNAERDGTLIAVAPELLSTVELFERSIKYEIARDKDEEGKRCKTITLRIVQDLLARARGETP